MTRLDKLHSLYNRAGSNLKTACADFEALFRLKVSDKKIDRKLRGILEASEGASVKIPRWIAVGLSLRTGAAWGRQRGGSVVTLHTERRRSLNFERTERRADEIWRESRVTRKRIRMGEARRQAAKEAVSGGKTPMGIKNVDDFLRAWDNWHRRTQKSKGKRQP